MTLNYNITFLDYWHIGSGLSAGSKADSTVLKDSKGLPYIGGKTLKGLFREHAEMLNDEAFVKSCFGLEGVDMGLCYFSNASIEKKIQTEILDNHLQDNLYDEIASTQIDADGMAVDGSLREIEVVIPLSLQGSIEDIPDAYMNQMKQAVTMLKRMGLNRNRGLGRCEITVEVA